MRELKLVSRYSTYEDRNIDKIIAGDFIHKVFYFLDSYRDKEDLDKAISKALSTTYVKEVEGLKGKLQKVLELDEVRRFFEDRKNLREMEIVGRDGKVMRIDRIVFFDDHIAVVDFKLGYEREEHRKQVLEYMDALENIFPQEIKGYLIYVEEPKVLKVTWEK